MNKNLDLVKDKKWLLWGGLYALAVLVVAAYLNYTQPYSPEPQTNPPFWAFILWGSLYLPLFVLPLTAGWKVTDLGFSLNVYLAIAACLAAAVCAPFPFNPKASWSSATIEAFARTGEEVFFRGFLFYLFIRLFKKRSRPWLWAVIASSILFTLIHTQTFQSSYLAQYDSLTSPALYRVIERLGNVFLIAIIVALLRAWTHSLLPGAILHCISGGGILTLPFVLIFYFGIIIWARLRGEPVAFGLRSPTTGVPNQP